MGSRWFKAHPITDELPHEPAVYVIYVEGVASYVGQTVSLRLRFREHKFMWGYGPEVQTPWGMAKDVFIKASKSRKFGDWAMRELRLIRRLRPINNCIGNRRKAGAK
jgi:hypothetical protein